MSKRRRRPPELTAAETAQVMKNMQQYMERDRVMRELEQKARLLEKLKSIKPAPATELIELRGVTLEQVKTVIQQTFIGKPWGNKQCPVWLPQDPNIPHADRTQCVRFGPHKEHSDTYLIEEQCLD